jgi:hypothetical protein
LREAMDDDTSAVILGLWKGSDELKNYHAEDETDAHHNAGYDLHAV